jgi:transcriptional regulator with XRE-family HTH domain
MAGQNLYQNRGCNLQLTKSNTKVVGSPVLNIIIGDKQGKKCMNFGENLQRLRKGKGISQERLAEIMEVSRQAISKWESNSAYPETEKLIALSDLFGVSIDYLIKGNESNETTDCVQGSGENTTIGETHKDTVQDRIVPVRQYRPLRTALAVILYAISPFWFYLLGEQPGGSGRGVFLMFLSIAVATGLLIYNHFIKRKEGKK